jgi:hypothetical protein
MGSPGYRRPPRQTSSGPGFVMITRSFEADMVADECDLTEIGLMTLLLAHPETKQIGALRRPNEWDDQFGGRDRVSAVLEGLQVKGKVVLEGYLILAISWLRRNGFDKPNYFKSGIYALSTQMTTAKAPLIRMVIATELLRLQLSDKTTAELDKSRMHQIAAEYWMELTGRDLVAHTAMTGSLEVPQPTMLEQIVEMPGAVDAYRKLQERNWSVLHPQLREPLERALAMRYDTSRVSTLASARAKHR